MDVAISHPARLLPDCTHPYHLIEWHSLPRDGRVRPYRAQRKRYNWSFRDMGRRFFGLAEGRVMDAQLGSIERERQQVAVGLGKVFYKS